MCGIIGFLGNQNFLEYIVNGLNMLQNRGYDSVGVAYIDICGNIINCKKASTTTHNSFQIIKNLLENESPISNIGIGHTRWATHGGKTDINAHPHTDNDNKIALVHNGIIDNYEELKLFLIKKGYKFYTDTDTEIIVVLISHFYKSMSMIMAIETCTKMMSGTWALTIISSNEPNKMWLVRNGSPLLLGYTDSIAIVCSEKLAFCNYVSHYVPLDNHLVLEMTYENEKITINSTIELDQKIYEEEQIIEQTPSPYNHWMEKEIYFQNQSAINAINNGGRLIDDVTVKLGGLEQYKNLLLQAEHLILLGCGTSLNAGLWSINMFKEMHLFKSVTAIDGAEFSELDIPDINTVYIMLSQSGETRDLIKCFSLLSNCTTIGVVNVTDSEIARQTTCGIYLNAGRELAVASTKSFTNQCIVLSLIAVWYAQNKNQCIQLRKQIINDIRLVSVHINNILVSNVDKTMNKLALEMKTCKSCFILGKGSAKAIAIESALKLKEISYIHAEGYNSSALKHGPFALIEKGLPIIILDTDNIHHESNMNAFNEVKSRLANVITIGIHNNNTYKIDKNKTFVGVLANIYLQILAYKIGILKEINPDFPRNLAKVVTVS